MIKKSLLLTLLLAILAPWAAQAQETVTIGEGTGTTYYFPIDNYFNYSCTQQIYTAEEIGIAGTIEAVSFYYNYGTAYTASNVTMYMKNVERSDFSSTTDCEALAPGDIVWTGSIAPTEAGWYTFELDTLFEYDGTSNLLVAFFDGTSGYPGTSYTWRQTTSPNSANMALRYYSDGTCPDPYNLSSYNGSKQYYTYRTNIQIVIEPAASDCPKPNNFVASNVTAHTADLSWESDANDFVLQYKKVSDSIWTEERLNEDEHSYSLTGLTAETEYQARVAAIHETCPIDPETNDHIPSDWRETSFTTLEACPKPTDLTVSNVGGHSATLSWTSDGNAWQIGYSTDGFATEQYVEVTENPYTLTGLTPETAYQVRVQNKCSEELYSIFTSPVSFTTDVACPAPSGLAAALTPGNGSVATLSWTSDASAWVVAYKTADATDFTEVNVTENPYTLTGLTPETTYNAKVKALCGGDDGESEWSNTITFTPTDAYTLTVNDGTTTNNYVPIFGTWVDNITKSQFIIPAENLADMAWGTINKMTFYGTNTGSNPTWGAAQFEVYITETNETTLSALADYGTMTKVMNSAHLQIDGNQMVVEFDAPYQYMGGNLMIGFLQTVSGSWSGCTWYGVSAEGASMGGYGSSISQRNFLPKTTFDYEPGEEPACMWPTNLAVSNVTAHTAELSWTSDGTAWQIGYSTDGFVTEQYVEVTENPYTLTGLDPETDYEVRVQTNCGGGTYSVFTNPVSFTTAVACPAPTGLAVSNITGHEATITWTSAAEAWQICVNDDEENLIGTTDTTYTLTGLAPETANTVKVRANCGDDGYSDWTNNVSFTTDVACPVPTGLAAALTPGNGSVATLSWTSDASAWVVAYKTADATDFTEVNVTENPYTLTSLTPETTYNAKVKAVCGGEDGESSWSNTITFTPTDAYTLTVNDGTTTNGYVPIYGFYVDAITKSQFIIPAENLANMAWGTINKMTFYAAADKSWGAAQFEVYMTETSDTTLSALADYGTMTKVKNAGSLSISGKQMVVELDAPYVYMGGNLMIGFLQTVTGTYSSCAWYGVSATGASMGGNGSSISQQNFLPKTTFDYEPGEEPSCIKPTGLAVEYTGGTEAIVSWTSDASAWNMRVNGVDVNGVITNPYTLTGLELATTYEVEVQANCGSDLSEWAGPVSFTTDLCLPENQCEITFELTDSYGDGWNGAYIDVVDAITGVSLGHMSNNNIAKAVETETYTLAVCDGREIQFVWHTGSFDDECSFVIKDINEEEIVSGSSSDLPFNYTVNCTVIPCKKPTDLAVSEIGGRSAVLSWTENGEATEWEVEITNSDNDSTIVWTAVTNPYTMLYLDPETNYSVRVLPHCVVEKWSDPITFTTLDVIVWNNPNDWPNDSVPEANANVTIPANTEVIIPSGYTAYADTITFGENASILIENGGELYHSNEVPVTMQLAYDPNYTSSKDGEPENGEYRLIAAPVNPGVAVSSTGLVPDINYPYVDLYYFDQNVGELVWINYKNPANNFDSLFIKKGYLYSNAQNMMGLFAGNTLPTSVDVKEPLEYNPDVLWAGWNLVGNPFTCMAYINRPYYKINGDGDAIAQAEGNSLEVFEGVFVLAEQADDTVTFSTTAPDSGGGFEPGPEEFKMLTLNLNNGRNLIDRAIVRFDEGRQLLKLQMGSSAKVYIPKDGSDYAIVSSDDTGEMPVSFKAENDGTYTMNFSSENVNFSYLHLIDNKTGDDIDLLETPSYSFEARTTDYASRFKLVFCTGNTMEDNFAFYSNGSFVINNEGEATLQVIDVTGRIVKSESINGSASVNVNAAAGVYMLRLINGDNVKVQKVVVR